MNETMKRVLSDHLLMLRDDLMGMRARLGHEVMDEAFDPGWLPTLTELRDYVLHGEQVEEEVEEEAESPAGYATQWDLSTLLINHRDETGLSRTALAEMIGVHPGTLSRIERHDAESLHSKTIDRLAKYFEMSKAEINSLFENQT